MLATGDTRRRLHLLKEVGQTIAVFLAIGGTIAALTTKTSTVKSRAAYDELKAQVEKDHDTIVRLTTLVELASAPAVASPVEMGAMLVTGSADAGPPAPAASTEPHVAALKPITRKEGVGGVPKSKSMPMPDSAPLRALRSFDEL
jgi:hypothetical protein